MKEKSITNSIVAFLKNLPSCFCWKEHGGAYSTAGIPDIVCCIAGQFVAFEVKTETGRLTGIQDRTLCRIRDAGGVAYVVRSLEEVKSILKNMEGINRWIT